METPAKHAVGLTGAAGTRRIVLTAGEQDLLHLVLSGYLPGGGFGVAAPQGDARNTVPPPLRRPRASIEFQPGEEVLLVDQEDAALAALRVTEVAAAGSSVEVDSDVLVCGVVSAVGDTTRGPFRNLQLTPDQVAPAPHGRRLVVPTEVPLNEEQIQKLASDGSAQVIVVALLGAGRRPLPSPAGLVRALTESLRRLPEGSEVIVVRLPRLAADEEQVARAAIAAALGGTEWSLPSAERSTAEPTLAAGLARRTAHDGASRQIGVVVMFTGLSGSGKSTIARGVHDLIVERADRPVTLLDGDVVRRHLSKGLGFSREDRDTNILRIGFVAAEVARHGGIAVCAPIAPYARTRAAVRELVGAAGGRFVLVHVATPLEVCEARDRKGLYAQARAGQIEAFTGVSDPYEVPTDADLRLDTTHLEVPAAVHAVVGLLVAQGLLHVEDGESI